MAAKLEKKLGKRGVRWWVVVDHGGKKQRVSYGTDRFEAEKAVRTVNRKLRDGSFGIEAPSTAPTFGEMVRQYRELDTDGLADTTRANLDSIIRKDGPLASLFDVPIDEFGLKMLRRW